MRLLHCNDNGEFSLTKNFVGDDIVPPYAILSHTWKDGQEVTFQDMTNGVGEHKSGYEKIRFCGQEAKRDGLRYFWIDTCCIDKLNLVELQEAINSMFRWYQKAAKCYVYLSEVSTAEWKTGDDISEYNWETAFRESRWFTRGWTLQELLAPRFVEFFSKEGKQLGNKRTLEQQLQERTGIAITALRGAPLHEFGIKERFSWAKDRQTTRKEDKAYSLFGIFDICIPVLYGEGEQNAFRRLHKEIDSYSINPRQKKAAFRSDKEEQAHVQHLRPIDSRDDKDYIGESNKKESIASTASQDNKGTSISSYDEFDSTPDSEDSDASSEPEAPAARRSPAPLQQVPKVQSKDAAMITTAPGTQSPSWLKPVVTMPSSVLVANMRKLDPSMHAPFAEMIFSNCIVACFDYYHENRLWRTKYSTEDTSQQRLFELDNGKFPKYQGDLSLRNWLLRLQRAYVRLNHADSIHAGDLYDFLGTCDNLFERLTRILLLVDPWGRLNIDNVEECLLLGIRLCRHIHGWDSFGRLTVVWKELHKPFADAEEAGFRLDLEKLMPPLKEHNSTGRTVSSTIPSKRTLDTALLEDIVFNE